MPGGPRESSDLPADAAGAQRLRDNRELRLALRSLEQNAPWIRHIHLVTNGQAPDWLDIDHSRSSLVNHAAIFPDPA